MHVFLLLALGGLPFSGPAQIQLTGHIRGDTICSKMNSRVQVAGFETDCQGLEIIFQNQPLDRDACWFELYSLPLGASTLHIRRHGEAVGQVTVVKVEPVTHVFLKVGNRLLGSNDTLSLSEVAQIERLAFVEECPLVQRKLWNYTLIAVYDGGGHAIEITLQEEEIPAAVIQRILENPGLSHLYILDIGISRGLNCETSGKPVGSLKLFVKPKDP